MGLFMELDTYMMNFKQWQIINETYGRFALGVKTPRSVGAVGSKLAELGLVPGDMADDLSGDGMDDMGGMDMGGDPGMDDMGGMDMGGDPGMDGGMDDLGMGGMDDMGGMGTGMGGKITIDDLDPSLLALLGLGKLAKQMGQPSPFGDDDEGEESLEGPEDEEGGNPFAGGGDDEGGEELDGDEGAPFGGEEDGDEEGGGNPFGSSSPSKDSDADGETDDVDDDDDNDGEPDDVDDDDDNDGVPDKVDKDKKKCASGKNSNMQYSKKFMGKNGMQRSCRNEDAAWMKGLVDMGRGTVHQKFESGMPQKKRRLEPQPGQIGYPTQTRLGQNWESVQNYRKRSK